MQEDVLALRFRQWADRELAFLTRMLEVEGPAADAYRAERAAIRRCVTWIETAADVPADERLINGGTRRLRHHDHAELGRILEANGSAAVTDDGDMAAIVSGCAPCDDELAAELAQVHP